MTIEERITERQKTREAMMKTLGSDYYIFPRDKQTIMLCEILDDFLFQKIQSDKVLEGILTDIQGNTASIAEMRVENLLT